MFSHLISVLTPPRSAASRRRARAAAQCEALEGRTLFSLLGIGALLNVPAVSLDSVTAGDGVVYNAGTHTFDVSGTPITMIVSTSPLLTAAITDPRSFHLDITVDNAGNASSGANPLQDVVLTGTVTINSVTYSGTLLTGTLEAMGYQAGSGGGTGVDQFDFEFAPTGGVLAPAFFVGQGIGVVLTTENSNFVDFTKSFSASPVKGYIGAVPQVGGGLSSLSGYNYVDCNNYGIFEPGQGEVGISGTTITLTGTNALGPITPIVTTTDATGFYQFSNLLPGTYTITETQNPLYVDGKDTQGTPGTGVTGNDVFSNIILGANVNGVNNNFGELLTCCYQGCAGQNGGGGNGNYSGCQITLCGYDNCGHWVSKTTCTDRNGNYCFTNLCEGHYTVSCSGNKNGGGSWSKCLSNKDAGWQAGCVGTNSSLWNNCWNSWWNN